MSPEPGRRAFVEQLLADGFEFVFGNPGTVEQGLLDALSEYPQLPYILSLQETVALAMADGYARATQRPAAVQLHTGVGLGNGIGMLYQAKRGHAPLVVFAGEAGVQYDSMDAQMAADLVAMARPVTKWATRVVDPRSLLRVLRRAIKTAITPPMGPVFVSVPMDILDAPNEEEVVPTSLVRTRVMPEQADLTAMARLLASAQRPLLIIGDGVGFSGAQSELERVAELVGAEVWGADSSQVNMDAAHELFQGLLGHMFGEHSRAIVARADVVLICGTYVFPEVFPMLAGAFAPGARLIHIDLDSVEIAKNFNVDIGVLADPKVTLGALAEVLAGMMSPEQKSAARARAKEVGEAKQRALETQFAGDRSIRDAVPMFSSRLMEELSTRLPEDAIIFDEALTNSPELARWWPGRFFQTRGGSLGVGFPGAIGIKLACPDKTVVGVAGDGGAMYTIQALWSAAHHNVAAKFVVCNNNSYELLKLNLQQYWRERDIPEHDFPASFDIAQPDLRFDQMARSMGVEAVRVEHPDQIGPAIDQALQHDGPFLIDAVLTNVVPGHKTHFKGGQ